MVAIATPTKPTWDEFYACNVGWIHTLAARLARSFSLEFEDVLQEFLLVLFKEYDKYDSARSRPTTWIAMKHRWAFHHIRLRSRARKRRDKPKHGPLWNADGEAIEVADLKAREPVDEIIGVEERLLVDDALEDLTDRERDIVRSRFGLDGDEPLTLREIAQQMGLTRERVRQIEGKGLQKLAERVGADAATVEGHYRPRTRRRA